MKKKSTQEVLGEILTRARVAKHLSTQELANKLNMPKSRPYLEDIEAGRKDLTGKQYDKLIGGCGTTLEEALTGGEVEPDLRKRQPHLYFMLDVIVERGGKEFIDHVRLELEMLSDKILREAWRPGKAAPEDENSAPKTETDVKKASRTQPRAAPSPEEGVGEDRKAGTAAESRKEKRQVRKQG